MGKEEFVNRCSLRLSSLLGLSDDSAKEIAETLFTEWDKIDTPEECAEEEASYWGD